jgi:hypothetical protein
VTTGAPGSSATDRLAAAFVACTLPESEWTHEAHLRVGLWHRLRMTAEMSLDTLRDRIRRYNESLGNANTDTDGYHETITRFYVILIDRFVATADVSQNIDDLADDLVARLGFRGLPLDHYSPDRLFSVEARRAWVAPDLAPLPPGPLA